MLDRLTQNWWTFAVQGAVSLVFGVLTLIWPGSSLWVMIVLFGAFALVTGIMLLAASFDSARRRVHWGSLLAAGILSVVAGMVTWLWPGLTAMSMLYLVAGWALVTGILFVVASLEFRDVLTHSWLLTLTGALSIVMAAVLAIHPRSGILALVLVVGVYAIAGGIGELVFAYRLHSLRQHVAKAITRFAHSS
jgi:uncharacterized membrane protein HdeD (DUF308 family)